MRGEGSCRLEQGKKQRMRKMRRRRKQFFFCLVVVLELFETGIVLNKSPIPIHTHKHTYTYSTHFTDRARGEQRKCSIQAGACFEYHTIA